MKLLLFLGLTAFTAAVLADDVSDLLSEAQRAYVRGDSAGAKEKFELVLRMDPQNRLANQYVKRIIGEQLNDLQNRGASNATETALKGITMPKVQFTEASLAEALEFLRQKGNAAAQGKVAINFVMQLDEATKARKVTLSLNYVPFTEVLRYIGQLAGVEFSYEPFAIVVKPKGATPAAVPTAQPAPGS